MKKQRNIKKIKCNECEKMITGYLKNNLSVYDVDIMLNHIDGCHSCMEELTIQYLVSEGLASVEKSGNYNLVEELQKKLQGSRKKIELNILRVNFSILILSIVFILSVLTIILLLI